MRARIRLIAAFALVALLTGIAVASGAAPITGAQHHGTPRASQAKLQRATTTVPAGVRKRLRILRISQGASAAAAGQAVPPMADGLVAAVNAGPTRGVGANPALARGVNTPAGAVYVVPGSEGLCHVAPGVVNCGPVSELDAVSHMTTINFLGTDQPGTARVTGVVPDTVSGVTVVMTDGSEQHVPVVLNTFGAIVPNAMREIDYATASGTVRQPIVYEPGTNIPEFQ